MQQNDPPVSGFFYAKMLRTKVTFLSASHTITHDHAPNMSTMCITLMVMCCERADISA
ncbi:hypothetical protein phiOS31_p22 [Serratia phage vB_SspS_OS31]|nr:hypothetical protein phiOS31_p22 [Serratia phage vB_SspS_OS31]